MKKLERKKEINERLIRDRIISDIWRLSEQEEQKLYKPKGVRNFWNNNYTEHESSRDRDSNLSLDKCLNKTEPYLRKIITNFQKSDTWKI